MSDQSNQQQQKKTAYLILKDGPTFSGIPFGYCNDESTRSGEIVFQTGMVGYIETLTDPSYHKQILVFTYPLVGNYGAPDDQQPELDEYGLPIYFESEKIWPIAIIIGELSSQYSHWSAKQSLDNYLQKNHVAGIQGIDTRELTKFLRNRGSTLAKIVYNLDDNLNHLPFYDPNTINLVAEVSMKQPKIFQNTNNNLIDSKFCPKILAIDCGIKFNQIRCLLKRGAQVQVVPWDYNLLDSSLKFDGLFISNGPGDPSYCDKLIENIQNLIKSKPDLPIFGICLGHQILARVAGAKTFKMKFGNRGQNQPVTFDNTLRCCITSQNHGFAVDPETLNPEQWQPIFTNANDQTNEGIAHRTKPYFSVQFHPEHMAGPEDMEFLFDVFLETIQFSMQKSTTNENVLPLNMRERIAKHFEPKPIPLKEFSMDSLKKSFPKKVLIIGSGGLSIGQAGEFDYSGSQALKALKEENIQSVLINPNIATVQTNPGMADITYFLPITKDFVLDVIENERPDGIFLMFGGQTAINCGLALENSGKLPEYNCKVYGTPVQSILLSEDRKNFAAQMEKIGAYVAPNADAYSVEEALKKADKVGYPILVRAGYSLGGLGSGFANNPDELRKITKQALVHSSQILLDKSLKGWKEVEYEVLRDAYDNCITVCNMENLDPLGIHTGESIVVAPSQTLTNREYNKLRSMAIKVIRYLGVVGECNIQYALNPQSEEFYIIEVNARLSRSSALASKATGYPLAYIAAKLALGYPLPLLINCVTNSTTACFEPSLDYLVVKIPRWDLGKFTNVSNQIGSSMKSVGEVMSIGRNFEEALQKALRMVDESVIGFDTTLHKATRQELEFPTDKRIFALASALKLDWSIEDLYQITKIDPWFLHKMKNIVDFEKKLIKLSEEKLQQQQISSNIPTPISNEDLLEAKKLGFSDKSIARLVLSSEMVIRKQRLDCKIRPLVKQVDTVSAEHPASTNYLYLTYNASESDILEGSNGIMVLGSGVYRIGCSVEFDCCAVVCIQELKKMNKKTIMVNCNPETVSTDYDICDRLYFEEISFETVMEINDLERPEGIILSMGGQLPNNIAMDLFRQKAIILGTSPESIDNAENRFKFSRLMDDVGLMQPQWKELTDIEAAKKFCSEVGYPCLIRPSYVLSGAAMNVAHSEKTLENYLNEATAVSKEHPVVISKFIKEAKEIDVDAVAQEGNLIAMAVSEHVENAGVHSGDATLVTPPQDLNRETLKKIKIICEKISRALAVNGPFNIQLIAKDNDLKIIECNLRVSRSFPFASKTLDCNLVAIATRVIMGVKESFVDLLTKSIEFDHHLNFQKFFSQKKVGVKVPQFSFERLTGADVTLGVEMASTGEVACFGENRYEAYLKAMLSTGFRLPQKRIALLSIGSHKHKMELLPSVRTLHQMNYKLYATLGTADFYNEKEIPVEAVEIPFLEEKNISDETKINDIANYLLEKEIDLLINLPMRNSGTRQVSTLGYRYRRAAVDYAIPLVSDVKCAKLLIEALKLIGKRPSVRTLIDCLTTKKIILLPGLIDVHVHLRDPGQTYKEDFKTGTSAAIAGGVTIVGVMGNTNPPITNETILNEVLLEAKKQAQCDFGIIMVATKDNSDELAKLSRQTRILAVKMYLDDTFGMLRLNTMDDCIKHFEKLPKNVIICCHAEERNVAMVLLLSELYDRHVHICHVSTEQSIKLIKRAKERGIRVSCEVTPHHLFLCEDDLEKIGKNFGKVKPKLGTKQDQLALWQHLDYIDCFATDHAPHSLEEKNSDDAPPGYPGLETMLPLLLNAVNDHRLKLDDLVDKLYKNPKRIFDLPDQPDTYIEIDLNHEWVIPDQMQFTKSKWTPFSGFKIRGYVRKTVLYNEVVYVDGRIKLRENLNYNLLQTLDRKNYPSSVVSPVDTSNLTQSASTSSSTTTVAAAAAASSVQSSDLTSIVIPTGGGGGDITNIPLLASPSSSSSSSHLHHQPIMKRYNDETKEIYLKMFKELGLTDKPFTTNLLFAQPSPSTMILPQQPISTIHGLQGKNILSIEDFNRDQLHDIFNLAHKLRICMAKELPLQRGDELIPVQTLLKGKLMAMMFYEASTRTQCSFIAAMERLGGGIVPMNVATSSVQKGETFEDSVVMMSLYSDVIVFRHPEKNSAQRAAKASQKPIINAGDGIGEHPTQALLDVFTIREEIGTVNNLVITICGDLLNGRTVHSLARMLTHYQIQLNYVSPPQLRMPQEVKDYVSKRNIIQREYQTLDDDVLQQSDVIYMTRIQKERFTDLKEYEKYCGLYVITPGMMTKAKEKMIVMHPLPRVNEISEDFDNDPRAAYFRQAECGVYVRMALLALVLGRF